MIAKLALAAAAAVGTYVATLGLPLPESCAAPSPSCGGDLRECLRQSADMRQTTFGGRYVTAEDVSRCMEAFNSCAHGGTSRGGQPVPPSSTPARGTNKGAVPQRFQIDGSGLDCTVSGDAVNCTSTQVVQTPTGDSTTTTEITGTLSGRTVNGTRVDRFVGPSVNGCVSKVNTSWPITFELNPDGTGSLTAAPGQWEQTLSGSCSGSHSGSEGGFGGPMTWSEK